MPIRAVKPRFRFRGTIRKDIRNAYRYVTFLIARNTKPGPTQNFMTAPQLAAMQEAQVDLLGWLNQKVNV